MHSDIITSQLVCEMHIDNNNTTSNKIISTSSMTTVPNPRKIFPLRLPESFHGPLLARPSLAEMTRLKVKERPAGNPEEFSPKKIVNWQKKRPDADVVRQRRQMLVHPAKLSEQNPDWLKTTYDYFRRNSVQPKKKQTRAERQSYDVFCRPRVITYAETPYARTKFSSNFDITDKVGYESRFRSTGFRDVTPKVGSVEYRNLQIRKPQMKVGKSDFIDTYSPF